MNSSKTESTLNLVTDFNYSEFIDNKNESLRLQKMYQATLHLPYLEAHSLVVYTYHFDISSEEFKKKTNILDVGSNLGTFKAALKKLGYEANVVNLDRDPKASMDVRADIEQLPFADNSFEVVMASWAIPDIIDSSTKDTLLANEIAELFRVTRKGGVMRFSPIKISYTNTSEKGLKITNKIYGNVVQTLKQLKEQFPEIKINIKKALQVGYSNIETPEDYHLILEIFK